MSCLCIGISKNLVFHFITFPCKALYFATFNCGCHMFAKVQCTYSKLIFQGFKYFMNWNCDFWFADDTIWMCKWSERIMWIHCNMIPNVSQRNSWLLSLRDCWKVTKLLRAVFHCFDLFARNFYCFWPKWEMKKKKPKSFLSMITTAANSHFCIFNSQCF